MVWNKDLAKLKQELKTEEKGDPKPPAPKPPPKPAVPRQLDDEDALFLAAMGGRRSAGPQMSEPSVGEPPPPKATPAQADFTEAMSTLKGMKPVSPPKIPLRQEPPAVSIPLMSAEPEPEVPNEAPPLVPVVEEAPAIEPVRSMPLLMQLAAGMAIEVDGALDLRGHSPVDAIERLKERILDGHLLGWRTLHIQLGAAAELRQAFLDFLAGPDANLLLRYAQAPIPMGGSQAWILYLGLPGQATH